MKLAPLCFASVVIAFACSPHQVSADEMMAALASKGLHVEKRADMEARPEWVGAERAVELVLDYEEPYRGVRFSSPDLARGQCQEGQGGVPFGTWCLEPLAPVPNHDIWGKVELLRTR